MIQSMLAFAFAFELAVLGAVFVGPKLSLTLKLSKKDDVAVLVFGPALEEDGEVEVLALAVDLVLGLPLISYP